MCSQKLWTLFDKQSEKWFSNICWINKITTWPYRYEAQAIKAYISDTPFPEVSEKMSLLSVQLSSDKCLPRNGVTRVSHSLDQTVSKYKLRMKTILQTDQIILFCYMIASWELWKSMTWTILKRKIQWTECCRWFYAHRFSHTHSSKTGTAFAVDVIKNSSGYLNSLVEERRMVNAIGMNSRIEKKSSWLAYIPRFNPSLFRKVICIQNLIT